MKIDDLLMILETAKKELGGDAPVCFSNWNRDSLTSDRYDFGEEGRSSYCCSVSPLEVREHVAAGVFHIQIRKLKLHPLFTTPTHKYTDFQKTNLRKIEDKIIPLYHKQLTEGYNVELEKYIEKNEWPI